MIIYEHIGTFQNWPCRTTTTLFAHILSSIPLSPTGGINQPDRHKPTVCSFKKKCNTVRSHMNIAYFENISTLIYLLNVLNFDPTRYTIKLTQVYILGPKVQRSTKCFNQVQYMLGQIFSTDMQVVPPLSNLEVQYINR